MFHVKTRRRRRLLSGGRCWLYSGGPQTTCAGRWERPRRQRRALARGMGTIGYTSVLLAVVVGSFHAGLSPEIEIAGVRPNLLLVAVVLVTALAGFGPGVVWA